MNYTTMMIDIIKSKEINKSDRKELQIYIKKCLDILNWIFKPTLEFEVIFSAGDEFQGLFRQVEGAILYYRLLQMLLSPIEIRCGIGYGNWDIRLEGGTSSEQDGPAYHYAREAIRLIQDRKDYNIFFNSRNAKDKYLNILLNTRSLLLSTQTKKQQKLQLLVESISPLIDKEVMIYDHNVIGELFSIDYKGEIFPIDVREIWEAPVVKGLSKIIAGITKTTRQNIESTIKKANIGFIRDIDIAIVQYVKENY